ncbi:MAG: alkaline phosphatase family protein [Phycisphaerales bacterium]|nr:MAG: alkaline phosphatase family protein [Phycisphaerales bacterium]
MSNRVVLWSIVIGLMASASGAALAVNQPQNIILFGWDGAQRNHVNECLARGELPNLQKLIDRGTCVEIDIEGKTDTKAGWSQILTGYYPEVTGVYSNRQYRPIPKGLSVFERLEQALGHDKFVTVAVIGKKGNVGGAAPKKTRVRQENDRSKAGKAGTSKGKAASSESEQAEPKKKRRPQGKIVVEDGVKYRVVPGQPFYIAKNSLDVFENGLQEDEKVGARAIELIEQYKDKPFFFFVHFAEVDHSGHKHGENSKQYNDALISNDFWTGKIADKIRELGLAEKTQFYVTADHGFNEDEKGHSLAPYVFLATNNERVNRNGRRQDVAPTILEAFGLDLSRIDPPLDGISLTKPDNRPPVKIAAPEPRKPDVVFVPTPQEVVDKMLELAQVTKDDVLYDLGCGDGRIVVTAAKRYGCKAVGYDIDPKRVKESLDNVQKNNVGHLARIEQRDIFSLDLSEASVITLYLLPQLNVKLIPQLERLKPGSRIVSHDFAMRGVKPEKVVKVKAGEYETGHEVFLWTCPLNIIKQKELAPVLSPY